MAGAGASSTLKVKNPRFGNLVKNTEPAKSNRQSLDTVPALCYCDAQTSCILPKFPVDLPVLVNKLLILNKSTFKRQGDFC